MPCNRGRVEQSTDIHGENNEKREGRGWQLMDGKNMIQDQRTKETIT